MGEELCKPVEVKDEQLVGPGQQDEVVLVQVALTRRVESRGSSRVTGWRGELSFDNMFFVLDKPLIIRFFHSSVPEGSISVAITYPVVRA